MKEQLQMLAQLLGAMAGCATKEELRASMLAAAVAEGETDDEDKPITYETMKPRDRAGLDDAIEGLVQTAALFDAATDARAKLCFKFYKSLTKAGFSEAEAIQIVANQDAMMVKG